MTLEETLAYYRRLNKHQVTAFTEKVPDVNMQRIVEEPFEGNMHLSMVFSEEIGRTKKDFLIAALHALEYDPHEISDELSKYVIQDSTYEQAIKEFSIPTTKKMLKEAEVTADHCLCCFKLKEKDELTFLLKTKTAYILLMEMYWKS
ncbi:MAG: hypothetical protein AAFO69_11475 [Bacteroidota bacterium]